MTRRRPIVIAHRGACGYLPEHTLAAKALAHGMGADFLEQDVVLSKDGVPIVMHDIYLEGTTDVAAHFPRRARDNGRFYAIDFTLQELRQLRVHERSILNEQGHRSAAYPHRFPQHSGFLDIHTLEEEIMLIAGLDHSRGRRTGLYIELKSPNWHLAEGLDLCAAIIDVLELTGYATRKSQVFLQCFDDKTLRHLRHNLNVALPQIQLIGDNQWGEDTEVDYAYLQTAEGLSEITNYADGIGPWLPQIYLGKTDTGGARLSPLVSQAQALGLQVHPYTFRQDELPQGIASFQELLDIFVLQAGVDGLFTDFTDLVVDYLDEIMPQ